MTPEERITALEQEIERLKNATTISYEVEQAFRARVGTDVAISSKAVASRTVNEGGSSSYSVALPMTGFITINVNGIVVNVPYY